MSDVPPSAGPTLLVSAAVLHDRRILLTKHGARWHLPDGELRRGETLHGALKRSIREDLGIAPDDLVCEALQPFHVSESINIANDTHYVTHHYRMTFRGPVVFLPREGLSVDWVSPNEAHRRKILTSTRNALIALGHLPS